MKTPFSLMRIGKGIAFLAVLGFGPLVYGVSDEAQAQRRAGAPAQAQTPPAQADSIAPEKEIVISSQVKINPAEMPSLLFTYWEHTALKDARRYRGSRKAPTAQELARDLRTNDLEPPPRPPPEERDISLGGIVFVAHNDWTIWLNGKRITPNAIPEEVLDLKVYDEYIEVRWFDDYTNQIFPIRLRPHQRFNIDTRMFLPG